MAVGGPRGVRCSHHADRIAMIFVGQIIDTKRNIILRF